MVSGLSEHSLRVFNYFAKFNTVFLNRQSFHWRNDHPLGVVSSRGVLLLQALERIPAKKKTPPRGGFLSIRVGTRQTASV